MGALILYPLFMILYGSLYSTRPGVPGEFTFQGYIDAFSNPRIISSLLNTFWLAIVRSVIAMAGAIVFAWLLARSDLPFKRPLEIMLWLYFFLPVLPMTMSWIFLLSPHYGLINKALMALPFINGPIFNVFSYAGIIWVHTPFGIAIRTLMITPAFRRMDASLEESARMCGARNLTAIFRITVPVLLPAILGAALLGFIKALESFEVELLLGSPVGIYVFSTKVYNLIHNIPSLYPPAMAMSMVFLVMIFILIFLNRRMIAGREYATITGRGFTARSVSLGRWRWPIFSIVLIFILVGTILPLAVLVLGSFMKYFGLWSADPFTTSHWVAVFNDPSFFRSLRNTFLMGIGVAVGGVLLYSVLSYIVVRTKLRGRGALDFISWLPWSVPGLLLAVGMLWAYVGGLPLPFTLYGTLWIMIIALIVSQTPLGMRLMNGTMVQIGKELEESAWVHGASWLYTFRRILMPLLRPAFIATGMIIFLAAVKDLVVVILLYSPKSRVLSTAMVGYWQGGFAEQAMVVGLVISAIVILGAILARFIGYREVM